MAMATMMTKFALPYAFTKQINFMNFASGLSACIRFPLIQVHWIVYWPQHNPLIFWKLQAAPFHVCVCMCVSLYISLVLSLFRYIIFREFQPKCCNIYVYTAPFNSIMISLKFDLLSVCLKYQWTVSSHFCLAAFWYVEFWELKTDLVR